MHLSLVASEATVQCCVHIRDGSILSLPLLLPPNAVLRGAAQTRLFGFSQNRSRAAVRLEAIVRLRLSFSCISRPCYLDGWKYFAATNSPIFFPMSVPTSVEVR